MLKSEIWRYLSRISKDSAKIKIKSKAIDDRFGAYMLCEMIKQELKYDTYFAFVIMEEEGRRGL